MANSNRSNYYYHPEHPVLLKNIKMKKFFDLRFVIGMFFLVVGILLLIYSFVSPSVAHPEVNRWSSIFFIAFAIIMIIMSFDKKPEDEL